MCLLTSTVGYEAVLLGKKVFVFGKVFYDFHKDVVSIDNPAELFTLFNDELNKQVNFDKNYNIYFVCAYYLSTKPEALNLMLIDGAATLSANKIYTLISFKKSQKKFHSSTQ